MKIGIMGGTFDPIHNGHLTIGEFAREEMELDKIVYIPAGISPYKDDQKILNSEQRYRLLDLAIKDNPFFTKSSIEIDKEGITYTVDTLRQLKEEHPEDELYFIIGEDCLYHLEYWKDFNLFKNLCSFLVFKRGIESNNTIESKILELKNKHNIDIYFLNSPIIDISSTDIRTRRKLNKSIKYLVPLDVEKYILEHGLYEGD